MHHSPAGHGSKLMFDVAVQSILVLKDIAQALHNLIRIRGMRCSHHEHLLQSGVFLLLRRNNIILLTIFMSGSNQAFLGGARCICLKNTAGWREKPVTSVALK